MCVSTNAGLHRDKETRDSEERLRTFPCARVWCFTTQLKHNDDRVRATPCQTATCQSSVKVRLATAGNESEGEAVSGGVRGESESGLVLRELGVSEARSWQAGRDGKCARGGVSVWHYLVLADHNADV